MKNILVYGASEHGKYTIDIIEKQAKYRVAGLIDDSVEIGRELYGYEVLGSGDELVSIMERDDIHGGVVAVGDNYVRFEIVEKIRGMIADFRFITAIHPFTSIGRDVSIGEGSVIMAGAIVNGSSRVGKHCFIATKASLDHDGFMGDYASLSPGATTGGNVSIGAFSTISIGATLKHGISIGEHSVIGAGATVLKEIPSHVVAYGSPCVVVRERSEGDKYL